MQHTIRARHSRHTGTFLRSVAYGALAGCLVVALGACQPSGRTPGQWLRGEVTAVPEDWAFTDDHQEISIEVSTPYFVPHSVTIWCAHVDGRLYVAAREPESKNWVGWMESNRDVRLKIGDMVYAVATADLTDETTLNQVRFAYAEKYDLPQPEAGKAQNVRYWAIVPRS